MVNSVTVAWTLAEPKVEKWPELSDVHMCFNRENNVCSEGKYVCRYFTGVSFLMCIYSTFDPKW